MAPNQKNIFTGNPDRIAGAVKTGLLTATAPIDAGGTQTGFTDSGYITDAGLNITPSESTQDIRDWGGDLVRRVLESFDGTLEWAFLETNEASAKAYFGDTNVTVTPATVSAGTKMKLVLNGIERTSKSWIFNIKDGVRKVTIYVPIGQVTARSALSLTRTGAFTWGVTLSAYPDALGNSIYIFTDDGVFSA